MKAGTKGERVLTMKKILKDYFNYLQEKDMVPSTVEEQKEWAKVCQIYLVSTELKLVSDCLCLGPFIMVYEQLALGKNYRQCEESFQADL